MKKHHTIIIAGAGGIAQAAALLLAEWSTITPSIYIGNRTLSKAEKVVRWVQDGINKPCDIQAFYLAEDDLTDKMQHVFKQGDALLDCLPGSLAPKMAQYAKDHQLHYANLTEYVNETNQITSLAKDASTGFVLQTGLAPGYIDVLAHHLFLQFYKDFKVKTVDTLQMKVGALTKHAVAPHYYGFTWSPVGVATEYIKECMALRNFKKTTLPALSERTTIRINGRPYEDDLTSGGAADLPDALVGKVRSLDYKTLRHPGHYEWVTAQLAHITSSKNTIETLQQVMQDNIPHIEDDQVLLYAAVEGKDARGILRRREIAKEIRPLRVGRYTLRAIQTTTAAPLLQAIQWLLEVSPKGVILQSQLDAPEFLNGQFITPVYGKPDHH